jgi:hypothetical protein
MSPLWPSTPVIMSGGGTICRGRQILADRMILALSLVGRLHDLEQELAFIHKSICFVLRVDEAICDGP